MMTSDTVLARTSNKHESSLSLCCDLLHSGGGHRIFQPFDTPFGPTCISSIYGILERINDVLIDSNIDLSVARLLTFDKTCYPTIPAKGHIPTPGFRVYGKTPLNIHRQCFEPANSVQTNIFSMYKQATQADICQMPLAVVGQNISRRGTGLVGLLP